MPDLNVLIKPASGNCNMRCRYCFYTDELKKRTTVTPAGMSIETAENLIMQAFRYVGKGNCTFVFQGGEPTLRGIDFFQDFTRLVKKYNSQSAAVNYCLQTNGLLLDDDWISFLRENEFLVGLSIDGPSIIHNENRVDVNGKDTFNRVVKTAGLLKKAKIQFNILTVVTARTAKNIDSIYNFFLKNGLFYQQYIPCLDPVFESRGNNPYSLSPEQYGDFLIKLFDRWYKDRNDGQFIYIHNFETLIGMILGYPPASCGSSGICSMQNVIETDGSVYPCDFYCLDEYKIGNINTDTFETINRNRIPFIEQSYAGLEKCRTCEYGRICRGGCRRDRQMPNGIEANYYCDSYRRFFQHSLLKLHAMAHRYE